MATNRSCPWLLRTSVGVVLAGMAPASAALPPPTVPGGPGVQTAAAAGDPELQPAVRSADDASTPMPPDTGDMAELWLETVLNQHPTGRVLRYAVAGDRYSAEARDLRRIGLRWPGSDDADGMVALDSIPGLTARYDAPSQRMWLQAPLDLLAGDVQRFDASPDRVARPDPAMLAPGLVLDYSFYAQRFEEAGRSVSAQTELRVFGLGPGHWLNTWNTRYRSGGDEPPGTAPVRLDTRWSLDFPERMLQLVVGDDLTGAVSWSRPTRFGGVRLGRAFALQPYRITTPLAAFAGQAALPSTVDLFISGVQQAQERVAPGRFEIQTPPRISGAGVARLVLTDLNGVERSIDVPFYTTSQLLADGLWDGSIELGRIRRDYGLRSFSYGERTIGSGTLRYGVSDRLTIETHGEVESRLRMGGLGVVWVPGPRTGVINAAYARSRVDGIGRGAQYSLGYQWNGAMFHIDAATTWRDSSFRDLASLETSPLPRRTTQGFAGVDTALGHFSAGYVLQRLPDAAESRIASVGWSQRFGRASSVYLTAFRDLALGEDSVWLTWQMALDRRTQVGAGWRHESGEGGTLSADIRRSVDSDLGGFGWQLRASREASGQASGLSQVDWLGRHAGAELGVSRTPAGTSALAGLQGGVAWMRGGPPQLVRRIANAFAIVSTEDVAGVPVRLENRLVGQTDRHGRLLVDRLNPWENNRLGIDILQLPEDMYVQRTEVSAVPDGNVGVLVRFPMHRTRPLQLTVLDASGEALPAGSPVYPEGATGDEPLTVIGYDSLLYLPDPVPGARLRIETAGGTCTVVVPAPQAGGAHPQEAVCR